MVIVDTFKMEHFNRYSPGSQSPGTISAEQRLGRPGPSRSQCCPVPRCEERARSCWLHSLLLMCFLHRNMHGHASSPGKCQDEPHLVFQLLLNRKKVIQRHTLSEFRDHHEALLCLGLALGVIAGGTHGVPECWDV